MVITELDPTPFHLPGGAAVLIATQRWVLEPWHGQDEPGLDPQWARKYKFVVNGKRSCAELAVLEHLRGDGWDGFWVSPFGPQLLISEWPPDSGVKRIRETGAPAWAAEIFDRLCTDRGKFYGFLDIFAWREPGEVRFDEVKVGPDDITDNQLRFVERALSLQHRLEQFTIIKVPKPI